MLGGIYHCTRKDARVTLILCDFFKWVKKHLTRWVSVV